MRFSAITLMLLAGLAITGAGAEDTVMTAGDLKELCSGTDHVSKNACRIYILGVTQGIKVGMSIADGKTKGRRPCVPEGVSGDVLEEQVKTRLGVDLAAAPAKASLDASTFIAGALASSFACTKASPSSQG